MRVTEVAAALKPFILKFATGAAGQLMAPDYVIATRGAECAATNVRTGQVDYFGANHATVIQSAINAAGIGGALEFRNGNYWLNAPLQPLSRQSWTLPFNATFRPTGNNRCIQAVGIDFWRVFGTLHIEDTDRNSSTAEAIYLDNINGSYVQNIFVWDYYKGMTLAGYTGRSYENHFEHISLNIVRYQGLGIWAEVGDHYFPNIWIKGPSTVEWATGQGLVIGLYPGVGTIFGGIYFGHVHLLDCWTNLDLQGLRECWFGQILSDNAYTAAIYIGDYVDRLSIQQLWATGSGDGIVIQGSTSRAARDLHFGRTICWVNARYGVLLNGYAEDIIFESLVLDENQESQLGFMRGECRDITISHLEILNTPAGALALDAGGVEENVQIHSAHVEGDIWGIDQIDVTGRSDVGSFQAKGVATIPNGATSVDVTHGLHSQPLYIDITPHHAELAQVYIANRGATTFTIAVPAAVTGDRHLTWQARVGWSEGTELLLNPNVDSGAVDNWVAFNGASIESVDVHSGGQALRINGNFHEWKSDPFTTIAGTRYRIKGHVKGIGNTFSELTLRFWKVTGGWSVLGEGTMPLDSDAYYVDGYVRVQGDFTAPTGTEATDVVLRNTAANTTDAYADDFFFGIPAGSNLLANPSVETGAPDNWVLDGVTLETGTARTGSKSLRVTNSSSQKQARATWVSVTASTLYEVSAWLQGQASGNVALVVQWYSDAGGIGNLIREDTHYVSGTFGSWTLAVAQFMAPASAQSAYFVFRMVGWTSYNLVGDSFSVKQLN